MRRLSRLLISALILIGPLFASPQRAPRAAWRVYKNVLFKSPDGGATWSAAKVYGLPRGIGKDPMTPIVAFASSDQDPRHSYVLTETQGVFRSDNDGVDWQNASSGLPVPMLHRMPHCLLAVHPLDSQRVYTLLSIQVTSHRNRAILFGSADAGRSWAPLKSLPSTTHFNSMTVDSSGKLALSTDDHRNFTIQTIDPIDSSPNSRPFVSLLGSATTGSISSALNRDIDNIAVIEDDGSIVTHEFDLSRTSFEFRPNGDGTYNVTAVQPQFDSDLGSPLVLSDEDSLSVALPFGFPFYSKLRQRVFVNSNGNISFERGDPSAFGSTSSFFGGPPRIAPLWADLDPASGGSLLIKSDPGKVVVTWNEVPLYSEADSNTLQVVLFPDGVIRFNYGGVDATAGITGVSNGFHTDGSYVDLSGAISFTGLPPGPIIQVFDIPDANPLRVAQRFYQTHDDDFDELVFFTASEYTTNLASGAEAYFVGIKNNIHGLGIGDVDYTSFVGSSGRLAGIVNMNRLSAYPDPITDPLPEDPAEANAITILGQETEHRYGAYLTFRDSDGASYDLLGRDVAHWSYFLDTNASVMEGNQWADNGNGTFTVLDQFRRYSTLDEYLMGLRDASEVPPLTLITNPQPLITGTITSFLSTFSNTNNAIRETGKNFGTPDRLKGLRLSLGQSSSLVTIRYSGRTQSGLAPDTISTNLNLRQVFSATIGQPYRVTKGPASTPQSRYFDSTTGRFSGENLVFTGTGRRVAIADIIDSEGERVPSAADSPKIFRHAFILVVPKGKTSAAADLAKISTVRTQWETFFRTATEGLGSVSTELRAGISRISRSVEPGGLSAYATAGAAADVSVGYGRLEGTSEAASGVVFITGRAAGKVVTETAVPAVGTLERARFYAEKTAAVNTGVAVASPLVAASVVFQLRNTDGSVFATSTLNLSAGSQTARFVNELFPNATFPGEFRGTLTMTATAPVTIVSLRTLVNEGGEFLMTTMPVANLDKPADVTSYLGHYADGAGYTTDVILMNPSSTSSGGSVEFRSPDGVVASSARFTIPPNGVQLISTGTGGGALRSGYVAIQTDDGQPAPLSRSIITLRQSSRVVAMTGMFPSTSSTRATLFVDLTDTHDGGLAVLNNTGVTANLRFTVSNSNGSPIQAPVTVTLGPRSQMARFASQLFTALPRGFRGMMEIRSDTPVQAVTLRSTTTDRFLLAAFPVETLDIPRTERVLYFPHLVDGAGFSSEIFVVNLGSTQSAPRLSFFSQQGSPLKLGLIQTR